MALQAALRHVASAPRGTALVEEQLGERSPLAGRRVSEVDWPPGTIVVSIQRGDQLQFPEPETILELDDVVSLLTHLDAADGLRFALRGDSRPEPEPPPESPDLI
jgi:Trk K+ transport system NAD-binding subunit